MLLFTINTRRFAFAMAVAAAFLSSATGNVHASEHAAPKTKSQAAKPKAEHGSGGHGSSESQGDSGHGGGHGESEHADVDINGIKLGDFKIRSDYPAEAEKSTVRFVLYVTVDAEHFDEMKHLVAAHQQKIRDEIITTTRLTPLGVFQEADLATFRRRILIRLRRTLPELGIDRLYVSDFGLIVKSL
jgi:hypothetical protein